MDPYVLKTAAICVAKIYDINAEMVIEQGFLTQLLNLLSNSNPMVVANAVAALTEIDEASQNPVFLISKITLPKLLAALEECSEWGQVFILTALAKYSPNDSKEAENITTRVSQRLQHANSSVVMSSIRLIMQYMNFIKNQDFILALCQKLGPPLVTLLSKQPEIQYVALRNINLIIQKRPTVLKSDIRVFFCKYNDPIYVKMEKLEIIILLSDERNIDQVLLELKEYTQEVDVDFVRRAVRAIGRCAIKIEKSAEKCVHVLIDTVKTKVSYVVQESIVVIKDIFRKYPNKYESIIALLCENLEALDEPEAKSSMIWIIGEYAEAIENVDQLLEPYVETFKDEPSQVQFQILTAVVKVFLKLFNKYPDSTQQMVQDVLNMATQEIDDHDLRDRAYIYWRLLSSDAVVAKQVILSPKPLIKNQVDNIDNHILDILIENISTLSSVYHKPPETFIAKLRYLSESRLLNYDNVADQVDKKIEIKSDSIKNLDLIDMIMPNISKKIVKNLVLDSSNGKGLIIQAAFVRQGGFIKLEMDLINQSNNPINQIKIKFKQNYFKLMPESVDLPLKYPLNSETTSQISIPIVLNNTQGPFTPNIDVAMQSNQDIIYFAIPLPLYIVFVENSPTDKNQYLQAWAKIEKETYKDIQNMFTSDLNVIQTKLANYNVSFVAKSKGNTQFTDIYYMSVKLENGLVILLELAFKDKLCKLCTKTSIEGFIPFVENSIQMILSE